MNRHDPQKGDLALKVRREVWHFLRENSLELFPFPCFEPRNIIYLERSREHFAEWLNNIATMERDSSFSFRDLTRQTEFCFSASCNLGGVQFVFCFNPLLQLYVSFLLSPNGYDLDTARYHAIEKRFVFELSNYFQKIRSLPTNLYGGSLPEFGNKTIVDLVFADKLFPSQIKFGETTSAIDAYLVDEHQHEEIIREINAFVYEYYQVDYCFYATYDQHYLVDTAMGFEANWRKLLQSLNDSTYIFQDLTLDPVFGFVASLSIDAGSNYILGLSPHLPYWIGIIQDKTNGIYSGVINSDREVDLEDSIHADNFPFVQTNTFAASQ
ncbi:MAG: hypothetical protein KDC53_19900 [Saprospiraceae bacterium]|nr:hypothetical protein [Saprospiraceae bacterium]